MGAVTVAVLLVTVVVVSPVAVRVAEAVAVLTREPATASAAVTVWDPVQIVEASGASVVAAQVIVATFGSVTTIPLRDALIEPFVTTNW